MGMTGLTVSGHAVYRYRERVGKTSREYARKKLLEMAAKGKEGGFRSRRDAAIALLNHYDGSLDRATYLLHGRWVIVVRDNKIKTIHQNDRDRYTDEGVHF